MKCDKLLMVAFLTLFVYCVHAEENYDATSYDDQFLGKEVSEPLQIVAQKKEKYYAGPLRQTEEDEVILVSRDNIQQLIKTLMLAYTHSKDPTMTQLFKSGSLGALKTSFKYLDKEDLGNSILTTAQKYMSELELENDEEALLGEFAEEFLETHKFKIVVPESFLMHEKEIVEFVDKKTKAKKKGRALPGFNDEEEEKKELELYSVLPYSGRQFSTSVIPGLDLTWLALLGGMIAIPYYFLADDGSSPAMVDRLSRKDTVSAPLANLAPPRINSINRHQFKKHKRPFRPNGGRRVLRPQGFRNNNLQLNGHLPPPPSGINVPSNNNQLLHQMKQNAPGMFPAEGDAKVTFLPPIHATPPHRGANRPPFSHEQSRFVPPPAGHVSLNSPSIAEDILPPHLQESQEQSKTSSADIGSLLPPPEPLLQEDGRPHQIPRASEQAGHQNIDRKQEFVSHLPPKPNAIQNFDDEKLKTINNDALHRIPHPPTVPNVNALAGAPVPPPLLAPFIPTHFPNGTMIPHFVRQHHIQRHHEQMKKQQHQQQQQQHQQHQNQQRPHFRQPFVPQLHPGVNPGHVQRPPQFPHPGLIQRPPHFSRPGPVQIPPQFPNAGLRQPIIPRNHIPPQFGLGLKRQPSVTHPQLPPFVHGQAPQVQRPFNSNVPLAGVRGVPHGVDQSGNQKSVQSNLQNPLFIEENRPGSSHFRVQHDRNIANQGHIRVPIREQIVPIDGDTLVDRLIKNDNILEESISSPTIVYATPQHNLPKETVKNKQDTAKTVLIFHTKNPNNEDRQALHVQNLPISQNIVNPQQVSNQVPKEHGGFVPIYGPVTNENTPQATKPVDFLDKLITQNQQNKKSNLQISYGLPFSVSDETGTYPPQMPEYFEAKSRIQNKAPVLENDNGAALFVQVSTEEPEPITGVTEENLPTNEQQSFRVVTSKSFVTSKPVPLDQTFDFNFGERLDDDEELLLKRDVQQDKIIPRPQLVEEVILNESPAEDRVFSSNQFIPQYEPKEGSATVEKSEPILAYSLNDENEIFNQNSEGLVDQSEDEDNEVQDGSLDASANDVERILKTVTLEDVFSSEPDDKDLPNRDRSLDNIPIYSLDPFYGPRLSRIDAIFHQMKLESEGCRQQVVCNMYKNPDGYAPLSDFLSRQLTVTLEELKKPQVKDERILRFFRYLHAATIGQDGGDCQYEYPECSQDTTKLYNKPTLDYYHRVTDLIDRSTFQS